MSTREPQEGIHMNRMASLRIYGVRSRKQSDKAVDAEKGVTSKVASKVGAFIGAITVKDTLENQWLSLPYFKEEMILKSGGEELVSSPSYFWKLLLVPFEAKRALVVCFFGRSGYGDVNCSSNIVDLILRRNVFSNSFEDDVSETAKGQIEGYYDEDLNTVFLNIRNPVDFSYMTRSMEEFHEDVQNKELQLLSSSVSARDYLIIASDFDARVGLSDTLTQVLAKFVLEHRCENGQRMVNYALMNHLVVRYTIFQHEPSYLLTWHSNDGVQIGQNHSFGDREYTDVAILLHPEKAHTMLDEVATWADCIGFKVITGKTKFKGFPIKLSEIKDTYARAVLFASLLSHILVMVEPTANFDISTIMFLKTLDNIRSRAKDCVSEAIRSVYGLPRTWAANGRPCSPRLLFLFLRLPLSIEQLKQFSSTKFETSVRKLETSLADKIYRLFRKSRVITNVSANSLLALPSSKPFVHVYRGTLNLKNRTEFMLDLLSHLCGDKVL
ncbi:hypothetical protein QYM36_008108, partial [Artemia franciscana]